MIISYVIPTRNRAHMVTKTIESIALQPYPHKEIIIVDDDSDDGLKEVIGQIDLPYLRYIHPGYHVGQNRARNIGIEYATGDLVTILDSDDCDFGTDLQIVVDAFQAYPGILGVFTPVVSMSTGKLLGSIDHAGILFAQKGFLDGTYAGEYQVFLRKQMLPREVFTEGLGIKRSCTLLAWLKLGADHQFVTINQKTRLYNDVHTERFGNIHHILEDSAEIATCFDCIDRQWGPRVKELSPRAYNDLMINLSYYQLLSAGRIKAFTSLLRIRPAPLNIYKLLFTLLSIVIGARGSRALRHRM